jgi:hypothetical protein
MAVVTIARQLGSGGDEVARHATPPTIGGSRSAAPGVRLDSV